ncbi:Uncharacterized membrane protein YbhN, UPF0104 family [Loktanella fryxellensis]|uniref:Uncharacterized membrane protein YbhN, UPF0104 family n=1 Tax=Loktanella fryxellensis TaxID=245187 RepID=A0A1H8GQH2_9RHOB|nr:lysylphosphatidylglycerol synthase domain-containing protein [Loktanella fryxellensis]SEN46226.1 Uncharacterized membrane protein YbhN, UPF0104 family [Loktanella fryxellensis]
MRGGVAKGLLRAGGIAVLIALFAWVLNDPALRARLSRADPVWIAAGTVCLLVQTVIMAQRWRLVAGQLGLTLGFGHAVREYFIAQIVNVSLPGGVVGDGARVVRSSGGRAGLRAATQAVVIERALGQAGLLLVGLCGLLWALVAPGVLDWPPALARGLLVVGAAAGAVAVIAALWLRGGPVALLLARCLPDAPQRAAHLVLSLAAAALNVAGFACAAAATGTVLHPQAALVLVPLILTAMLVPLSVAGWGWREGAAAVLFPVAGLAADAGIAAGIVFGIVIMLAVLPAVPLLLRRRRQGGAGPTATVAPDADLRHPHPKAVHT